MFATALAAGLVAMAARRSKPTWTDAAAAAGQANVLRARAVALLPESGAAYEVAMAQLEAAKERNAASEVRDWSLGQALRRGAEAPLACAEIAADVAELAGEVAPSCEPASRPDAIAAARLAESAALIGANLVEVNLVAGVDDELREQAETAVGRARRGRERAVSESAG
jgi:formiminotetrahydrofolate cyclodeaminase